MDILKDVSEMSDQRRKLIFEKLKLWKESFFVKGEVEVENPLWYHICKIERITPSIRLALGLSPLTESLLILEFSESLAMSYGLSTAPDLARLNPTLLALVPYEVRRLNYNVLSSEARNAGHPHLVYLDLTDKTPRRCFFTNKAGVTQEMKDITDNTTSLETLMVGPR